MSKKLKTNGYHDPSLVERARVFRKQKALGQNFLVSSIVLEDIISFTVSPTETPSVDGDLVLEIGSGIGFLTEKLAPLVRKLYAVELDASCINHLKLIEINNPSLEVHRADILGVELRDLLGEELTSKILRGEEEKIKIIANIPYQISSRIITHFLGEIGDDLKAAQQERSTTVEANARPANHELISEINILVQKEFADRLCADPTTKDFGSLTLLVNYWAEVEKLFDVPRSMFMPEPQVDSTFISIKLRDKALVALKDHKEAQALRRMIKAIYANRRKTMNNALKAASYPSEIIKKLDLDNLRGETLELEEILELVRRIEDLTPLEP